ncbi:MAG: hypothetical protein HON90_01095 [Halobacteriovoraceae bacterium]|jgi:methyl-accepting chemotaxis protein|nr:hypothetical protein [Halobacteriovoraceae bacterium]
MLGKTSLSNKIIVGFLLSGLIPCMILSVFVYQQTKESLLEEAQKKLISVREVRAFQLESLYETMAGQVKALAANKVTLNATTEFIKGFSRFQLDGSKKEEKITSLKKYYDEQFSQSYQKSNNEKETNRTNEILDTMKPIAKDLQYTYISNNEFPLGEKDKLYDVGNKTLYNDVHINYHDTYRKYLNTFGYYDIFLVSTRGTVVYSVFKELDFATNLLTGPYKGSGLANAFKGALNKKEGEHFFTEINKYFPSYESPAQFVSAPVYVDSKLYGVLVFQIPVAKINHIMTGNQKWKEQGQGNSGETYIIGKDKSMKSLSRFLAEDEKGFFTTMKDLGVVQEDLDYMKAKKTSAVVAKIETSGAEKVINGEKGFAIFPDYRGVNVLSAFKPLHIPGLEWFVLSEMDEDEALSSVYYMQKVIFALVAFAMFINFLMSFFFSGSISKQLVTLSTKLQHAAESLMSASKGVSLGASDLSASTQEQAASLQETSSSINEIAAMVDTTSISAKEAAELSESSQVNANNGQKKIEYLKVKIDEIHNSNNNLINSVEKNNNEVENIKNVISEIGNKTKVINDIVFQTKLLSFNASVEAARAGEVGKGFAVVAEEIGALAEMSGTAAAEISDLLTKSIKEVSQIVEKSKSNISSVVDEGKEKVNEGLKEVQNATEILRGLVSDFQKVNSSVQEIAHSSSEQAVGVGEVNQAIAQIDQATQLSTQVAHDSLQRASSLKDEADNLAHLVANIQAIVFGKDKRLRIDEAKKSKLNNRTTSPNTLSVKKAA